MSVKMPEQVKAGEFLDIALTVTNGGGTPTSSLLGRTFSRHEWLQGRLFYVGTVAPGASVTFTRRIQVPADARGGVVFGALGFWDLLGTIPGKELALQSVVEAVPQPEAKAGPQAQP
jgi:hypothetical protein